MELKTDFYTEVCFPVLAVSIISNRCVESPIYYSTLHRQAILLLSRKYVEIPEFMFDNVLGWAVSSAHYLSYL